MCFKETNNDMRCCFVSPGVYKATGCYLLDLLCIFVADEDDNWINVNAVEPFDGVRGDVEQTVTALHLKRKKEREHHVR